MTAKTALPGDLSGPAESHASYAARADATKCLDMIRAPWMREKAPKRAAFVALPR